MEKKGIKEVTGLNNLCALSVGKKHKSRITCNIAPTRHNKPTTVMKIQRVTIKFD